MGISIDNRNFLKKTKELSNLIGDKVKRSVNEVAEEVLRLSQFEVPHDTGMLQNSGHVEYEKDYVAVVGYNKVYAARLHENPQYNFQKGRKGKYLEDPIKNNLLILRQHLINSVKL